jgi:hypothetical protein
VAENGSSIRNVAKYIFLLIDASPFTIRITSA